MIIINPNACPKNHACPAARKCPEGAIAQANIFSAPRIDPDLCTECGQCTMMCRAFVEVAEPVGVR